MMRQLLYSELIKFKFELLQKSAISLGKYHNYCGFTIDIIGWKVF